MELEWSLGNAAWLLGIFLLALAPAVLYLLLAKSRHGDRHRRKRYRPR
jgi:hypothetical protein